MKVCEFCNFKVRKLHSFTQGTALMEPRTICLCRLCFRTVTTGTLFGERESRFIIAHVNLLENLRRQRAKQA